MSWVALVGPEYEENLALRYLASSLTAAGYGSELVVFNNEADLPRVIDDVLGRRSEAPLVVAIQLAFQWRALDMTALAIGLRERGYGGHITTGGHFATFECQNLLRDFPDFDSVCRHEAEETLVELVHAIDGGTPLEEVPGLALQRGEAGPHLTPMRRPPELATLPWPDRRGPPSRCLGHAVAPLVGSRGCYAQCSFCCIAAWHEQTLPGKRYRLRDVEDIADEMVAMQRERDVDVFVFHDDNFFVPSHKKNYERLSALADALEARGIGPFGTVVKARPDDVEPESFRVLRDRLHVLRVYVGIESDADQGLVTLARRVESPQNHAAVRTLRELGIFTSFNLLIFDPDTTLESFETNVEFMAGALDCTFNFCRTELYAGTPLLARMEAEGRTTGDYLFHDYTLASPEVQRVFQLAMEAFWARNFGDDSLNNDIGGWRLHLEICRRFHPDVYRPVWLERMHVLHRRLGLDTVAGLRQILEQVREHPPEQDAAFVAALSDELRGVEHRLCAEWTALKEEIVDVLTSAGASTRSIGLEITPLLQSTQGVPGVG